MWKPKEAGIEKEKKTIMEQKALWLYFQFQNVNKILKDETDETFGEEKFDRK